MKNSLVTLIVILCMLLMETPVAQADVWNFTGSRYQAMGGTGVAFSDDSLSAYWNPANLAFQKGWDVQIPVTANGEIVNLAAEKLSDLLQRASDMESTLSQYVDCIGLECSDIPAELPQTEEIVGFLYDLSRLGKEAESVYVDVEFGILGRYNNFAFSALSLTTATIYPNIDTENVDLGARPGDWIPCPPPSPAPACNTPQDTQFFERMKQEADPLRWSEEEIGQFIWSMEQINGGQELGPDQKSIVNSVITSTGSFADNQSGALSAGLSTQEFAVSWSHTIPVPGFDKMEGTSKKIFGYIHDKVSLGITPKYILGITFLNFSSYNGGQTISGVARDLTDLDSRTISHNFGLDIGMSFRPVEWFQLGLVARNVNSPEFDVDTFKTVRGRVIDSIELPAQVRLGIALRPFRNLILSSDIDLTQNSVTTIPGFESRILSVGAEYRIGMGRHVDLNLRLGTFGNLSGYGGDDWSMTGGLGLRFGSFAIDLSGGGEFSENLVRTGSTSYTNLPSGLNLGLGFKWVKSL